MIHYMYLAYPVTLTKMVLIIRILRNKIQVVSFRENLNDREGKTNSKPVDKYYFTWTTKCARGYPRYTIYANI